MGNFEFDGSFTALPDPDYQPFRLPLRGMFVGGKPARQGWESGELKFPPLASGAFNELRQTWEAKKNAYTVGKLPKISGYGWRTITAWWHDPVPTGWDGEFAHGVTMLVTKVVGN